MQLYFLLVLQVPHPANPFSWETENEWAQGASEEKWRDRMATARRGQLRHLKVTQGPEEKSEAQNRSEKAKAGLEVQI